MIYELFAGWLAGWLAGWTIGRPVGICCDGDMAIWQCDWFMRGLCGHNVQEKLIVSELDSKNYNQFMFSVMIRDSREPFPFLPNGNAMAIRIESKLKSF